MTMTTDENETTPEATATTTTTTTPPEPTGTTTTTTPSAERQLHSAHSTGMEASVLRVKDVNFMVGKGEKQKQILTDINVKVKWGHVLARESHEMADNGRHWKMYTPAC